MRALSTPKHCHVPLLGGAGAASGSVVGVGSARDPAADLRRIAFLLERTREPTYRVRAFRTAAGVVDGLAADELPSAPPPAR